MNYVILNGKKSTAVQGLLIQELPPISKPQVRSSIETIDGRDGDIVTKLGYSAYDKQLVIGLYGQYDIDDVIEYFNSELSRSPTRTINIINTRYLKQSTLNG